MKKIGKKAFVIFATIAFIMSSATGAYAVNVQNELTIEETTGSEQTIIVSALKYSFDGSAEPIKIEVQVSEGEDIDEAIEEKIDEILAQDDELLNLLANNSTQGLITKIVSRGRGLHLKFNVRVQLLKLFKLFPLLPPYFLTAWIVPTVICRYPNDQGAFTTISDFQGNITISVEGPQRVLSIGFYGISWWIGKVSFLGFVARTGFRGISLYTNIKEL